MLDKITITKEILGSSVKLAGRKPAKLSAMPKFKSKTMSLMDSVPAVTPVINTSPVTTPSQEKVVSQMPSEAPKQPEQPTAPIVNLPTIEECKRRLDSIGVTCTEILPVNKLSSTRKLRAAPRVSKVMRLINCHVVKVNLNTQKEEEHIKEEAHEDKTTFDFSKSFNEVSNDTKQEETEKPYSWLRNEEVITKTKEEKDDVDDANVVEFQTLMEQKATTVDSLATQKEILMNLRRKVEENNALCEAKKRDLIEENMALTQELNDVLAEINQLSDTVSQQEAFLGISENTKNR